MRRAVAVPGTRGSPAPPASAGRGSRGPGRRRCRGPPRRFRAGPQPGQQVAERVHLGHRQAPPVGPDHQIDSHGQAPGEAGRRPRADLKRPRPRLGTEHGRDHAEVTPGATEMQVGHGAAPGTDDRVGGRAVHDDHPQVYRAPADARLGKPALDVETVSGQQVDDRRQVRLVLINLDPQGVAQPFGGQLRRGHRPDPVARRVQGDDPRGRRAMGRFDEHPPPAHLPHPLAQLGIAADRPEKRGRHRHPGRRQPGVTAPLVEHHRDVLDIGEQHGPRHPVDRLADPRRPGDERGVPACPTTDPGRLAASAQQLVRLRVLPWRVDPYQRARLDPDLRTAQHGRPRQDRGLAQSLPDAGVGEHGHPPLPRRADDGERGHSETAT